MNNAKAHLTVIFPVSCRFSVDTHFTNKPISKPLLSYNYINSQTTSVFNKTFFFSLRIVSKETWLKIVGVLLILYAK